MNAKEYERAKEYVKQIIKIHTQMKNKNFELKQLEESDLPTESVRAEMSELERKKKAIIKTIEQLPEEEYDMLHRLYYQQQTLYEAAAGRNISYGLASLIHRRALMNLDDIINRAL